MTKLLENPFMQKKDDFLKSPAEAPADRKVLLEDKDISPKTQKAFKKLCENMMKSYQKTVVTLAKPC